MTKGDENIIVNIAFNIADPLHDELLEISQEISKEYGSTWYMDDKRFFLHLSIYLMTLPAKNKDTLIEKGESFASELIPIDLETEELIFTEGGLVILNFKENSNLYEYHKKALEVFNPLREGMLREKYLDNSYFDALAKDEQEKLKRYGHIYVMEKFKPHITIARLDSKSKCRQVVQSYSETLSKRSTRTQKFQIHEALYFPENKNILLVDEVLSK